MPASPSAHRRALQIAVAIFALVPISAGLGGVVLGSAFIDAAGDATADSHVRYLSGLLLAIGLGFWSTVPRIEEKTARFRLLTAIVVVGGLGRLLSLLAVGVPSVPMLLGLAMELVVTPALCVWQGRVARGDPRHSD